MVKTGITDKGKGVNNARSPTPSTHVSPHVWSAQQQRAIKGAASRQTAAANSAAAPECAEAEDCAARAAGAAAPKCAAALRHLEAACCAAPAAEPLRRNFPS